MYLVVCVGMLLFTPPVGVRPVVVPLLTLPPKRSTSNSSRRLPLPNHNPTLSLFRLFFLTRDVSTYLAVNDSNLYVLPTQRHPSMTESKPARPIIPRTPVPVLGPRVVRNSQ